MPLNSARFSSRTSLGKTGELASLDSCGNGPLKWIGGGGGDFFVIYDFSIFAFCFGCCCKTMVWTAEMVQVIPMKRTLVSSP